METRCGFLQQLELWADWKDDTVAFNAEAAAVVNGVPILNVEVLQRYGGVLASARESLQKSGHSPAEYTKFRESLIQRDVADHVQRRLLIEWLNSSVPPEQFGAAKAHIDLRFDREIEKLNQELKTVTREELEVALKQRGTTLQQVKDNFSAEQLAQQAVMHHVGKAKPIERAELAAYYETHATEFANLTKVKWEQIQISFDEKRPLDEARRLMNAAMAELNGETPFADVAKMYSDGPTAKSGGQRDWMTSGNLVDTKLEAALFEMPIGELSPIHEGPSDLHIVRVIERQPESTTSFDDVQDTIRTTLEQARRTQQFKELIDELFSKAKIETKYDVRSATPEKL